jgi:L-glyceraldehyde 3-phosphate reductase
VIPTANRYDQIPYRRCGRSGLRLPAISLGLWHNFGSVDPFETARAMVRRAFDRGITHFDLANNYGPEPGSAEETFGRILRKDLAGHRDELVISSKAGYRMWAGPYGDGGSRKYMLASLDQSLRRMGLEYVDIFYHHRPDPDTPLEESMLALHQAVHQGKALYVGISSYDPEQTLAAARLLRELRTPFLIHQPRYSMFDRTIEHGLLDVLSAEGIGCIVFSPLAQGLLTNRYLGEVPPDSRAGKPHGFLRPDAITPGRRAQIARLNELAAGRGQSLAQLAIAWVLRHEAVTSALVGTSRVEQVEDNLAALDNLAFSDEELGAIDQTLADDGVAAIRALAPSSRTRRGGS